MAVEIETTESISQVDMKQRACLAELSEMLGIGSVQIAALVQEFEQIKHANIGVLSAGLTGIDIDPDCSVNLTLYSIQHQFDVGFPAVACNNIFFLEH